ncbi:hypothetical protein [Roseobacter sinensis]|uniref:Type I secretion target repeat protein n=1 Tax=Roseobacter sinensis TaxID=2931391 RepID=A0ABT3BJ48_9RHOB|nr:hypothetical protein [Roseobacter sp. WL0113]MCV3273587.1 hypothetical protein [Roseobacter sp. WL0113]
MSFDPITEKIAHFIGAFQIIEEQARLRAEYDEFRALQASEDRAEALELLSSSITHSHKLKDFSPDLQWKPLLIGSAAPDLPGVAPTVPPADIVEPGAPLAYQQPALVPAEGFNGTADSSMIFFLPLPSSVATVTFQKATLFDNDIFGDIAGHGFESIAPLTSLLEYLAQMADYLSPLNIDVSVLDADLFDLVADIQAAADSIAEQPTDGVEVSLLRGEDTDGIHLNGEEIAELPEWEDILPAYHANRLAEDKNGQDDETVKGGAGTEFDREVQDTAESHFKVDDGHQIVAGANVLTNAASITSSWLDASVFAVGGDVLRFDAISQVNVLIDHDSAVHGLGFDGDGTGPNKALNAASLSTQTVQEAMAAADDDPETSEDDAPASPEEPADHSASSEAAGPSPQHWVVERLEGDVVQMNWVKQYTFSTDFDQAAITIQGASSFIGLGENQISNHLSTFQLGYNYDLIVVAGDMIDVNLIDQRNVVLDGDKVKSQDDGPRPSVSSEQTGAATRGEAQSAEDVIGLSSQAASPVSASVEDDDDADDPRVEQAEAEDLDADAPVDEPVYDDKPVHPSGDNLLYNEATIEKAGFDKDAEIKQNFEDAIAAFSSGSDDVDAEVLEDPLFNGTELLRVLYVDGDFKSVNALEQTNILGDADQVHLAVDEFAAALQQEIELVAGSNIAANFAAIRDNGLDSEVMAQGETYSDALIHQANLIDTDPAPPGATIADLATEAVAFLADDIVDQNLGEEILAQTASMVADVPQAADIMQELVV